MYIYKTETNRKHKLTTRASDARRVINKQVQLCYCILTTSFPAQETLGIVTH